MGLAMVLLFCAGPARAQNASTQTYNSAKGRFSVLFPAGEITQKTEQTRPQNGAGTTKHIFWLELDDNNVSYMVMYSDYPDDFPLAAPQTVLASARDGALKNKTLASDAEIELNGVPGRAFTAIGKGWNFSIRQFLAGRRLYQLIVVSNSGHPAALTGQFMDSFRIN